MAESVGDRTVESALAAYNEVGTALYGEFPLDDGERWLATCNESELTPEQQLRASWLGIELGFAIFTEQDIQRARQQKKLGKNKIRTGSAPPSRGTALIGQAMDRLIELMDSEVVEADPVLDAHAGLTYGMAPVVASIRAATDPKVSRLKALREFNLGQAYAVNALHSAITRGQLSERQMPFVKMVNAIVIGSNLLGNEISILPAPPRCYEDREPDDSWHGILWNARKNRNLNIALTEHTRLRDIAAILSDEWLGRDYRELDDVELLEQIHTAMLDKGQSVPPESKLGIAAVSWAKFYRQSTKTHQSSVLKLPELVRFAEKPGEPIQLPVDLDPVDYPPLSVESIGTTDILTWYGRQVNGRPLTSREGLLLDRQINDFATPAQLDRLSLSEHLLLNKLRLDAALTLSSQYPAASVKLIKRASVWSREAQGLGRDYDDTASVFEAFIDDLTASVLYGALNGEALKDASNEVVVEELLELLLEIADERNRTKDRTEAERFKELLSRTLHPILVMRFTSENLMALPSFPREQGDEAHPGWDINAWPILADGHIDLQARRKIRFSDEVSRPMRQGDIGIIPQEVIRKTAPVLDIAKSFVSLRRKDERAKRSGKLIAKWGETLRPTIDEAIRLASSSS